MNPIAAHRPGRNEPCHCGSGRKYKQCCLGKDEAEARAARTEAAAAEAAARAEAAAKTEGEAPAPAAQTPARAKAPRPQTQQPWKRSAANTHGFQRVSTPRKVGGG